MNSGTRHVRYPWRNTLHCRVSSNPWPLITHLTNYGCSFLAEVGLFTSHIIWRLRHRKLVTAAKKSGKSIDELLAEKKDGKDMENETTASSVVQTPMEQGRPAGYHETATVTSAEEERDIERGPD